MVIASPEKNVVIVLICVLLYCRMRIGLVNPARGMRPARTYDDQRTNGSPRRVSPSRRARGTPRRAARPTRFGEREKRLLRHRRRFFLRLRPRAFHAAIRLAAD